VQFALHHEEGQGLVEYGLILVLIAVVAVGALVFLSGVINQLLSTVGAVI
jgi:pilus assembly protein Flp/PilA